MLNSALCWGGGAEQPRDQGMDEGAPCDFHLGAGDLF